MAQRDSGYRRIKHDAYQTREPWITEAVVPYLGKQKLIWECAAGKGLMVADLRKAGYKVIASDIKNGEDFLETKKAPRGVTAIVTNPPYSMADKFVKHALELMIPNNGMVAMLLPAEFDFAKTRWHFFTLPFKYKILLTQRIWWFKPKPDDKGPSKHHAWYVWDWKNRSSPRMEWDYQRD